jgi:hypothetical protein
MIKKGSGLSGDDFTGKFYFNKTFFWLTKQKNYVYHHYLIQL